MKTIFTWKLKTSGGRDAAPGEGGAGPASSAVQARDTPEREAAAGSLYLSVPSWWPRSTGFEVETGEGAGRGVKAAVVQNPRRFCSTPLSAPQGHGRPGLPWGPYWPRASKQRQRDNDAQAGSDETACLSHQTPPPRDVR